ncbi:MAG: peptidoglycan -binding protein [Rhodospirillaceae bacterium]|nr:peptidoglycan -binding protein [Rhodospirillaceae bacterium]
MRGASRRIVRQTDIWPGFVDALATLLMVIIFVLMIFSLFQFYLSDALTGRDEALLKLNGQIVELGDMLALERRASADLRATVAQLSAELQSSTSNRDSSQQSLAELRASRDALQLELNQLRGRADINAAAAGRVSRELEDANKLIAADREKIEIQLGEIANLRNQVESLRLLRQELELQVAAKANEIGRTQQELSTERRQSIEAQARIDLMNRQLAALRDQMASLNALLEASEAKVKESQTQVVDLGRRLNVALAGRVEELARYRSEFFGRLREVLGDRADIRVVGDRFVFQSEVLFPSSSAELEPEGQGQLAQLAESLRQIADRIPPELNWVLQVDGHTDRRPISTATFPSNWELSTSRATSVVKFLVSRGVPPQRLTAAGFGEFQPLDPRDDEIAYRRNRRIELKLTNR